MKKEIKEEVNIMEGIDFKTNQKKVRKQIKTRTIQRKEQLRKLNRRLNVSLILLVIVTITLIVMIWNYLHKTSDDIYKNCLEKGYDVNYCVEKAYR